MEIKKKEEVIKTIPENTINKGFTQVSDCINMCYDLTTDEKVLYAFILKNYNDEIGYSFPSWQYMKFVLNRGDGKINESLKGLQEKGLISRKKTRGKNNRYYLNPLYEVPCIALSEATYRFIKKANELDLNVWDIVKIVIRSDKYSYFKENYIPHKKDRVKKDLGSFLGSKSEEEICTTDEYLLFLKQKVKDEIGEEIPVDVYSGIIALNGRKLNFQ